MIRLRLIFIALCCLYSQVQAAPLSLLDFHLPNIKEEGTLSLEQYRGKLLLLSFFEPNCRWCYRQMKVFNQVSRNCSHKIQPVAIGINGPAPKLRKEIRKAKVEFPALVATHELLSAVGKVPATPWTLVTDQNGNIVATLRGYMAAEKLNRLFEGTCSV